MMTHSESAWCLKIKAVQWMSGAVTSLSADINSASVQDGNMLAVLHAGDCCAGQQHYSKCSEQTAVS